MKCNLNLLQMHAQCKNTTRNIDARTKVMGRRNFQDSIIVSINKRCFFKCLKTMNSNRLLFTQYVCR